MDVKDKVCLITGATNGIGKEVARELARSGAEVIFTSRNIEKGEKVKEELISSANNKKISVYKCDLSSFKSVKEFARNFKKDYKSLHILINNAGTWEVKRKLSEDGIEMIFAVNHLSHFLLTNLLLDVIKQSAPARIINVSSAAHKNGKINFNDLEMKEHFNGYKAYCQSKHANVLFTKKLAQMLEDSEVSVNTLHPGVVDTGIFKHLPALLRKAMKVFMIKPEKGAKPILYLATSEEVSGITGAYFNKNRREASTAEAADREQAHKLWKISEDYVKNYL